MSKLAWLLLAALVWAGIIDANVLSSGGATFPSVVYQNWTTQFSYNGTAMIYSPTSSGIGVQSLISDPTFAFAGSDTIPTHAGTYGPNTTSSGLVGIPSVVGMNADECSPPGSSYPSMVLSRQNMVDIFSGSLSRWNDSRLTALNPWLSAISASIQVVIHSGTSGTTRNLLKSLASFNSSVGSVSTTFPLTNWQNGVATGPQPIMSPTNMALCSVIQSVPFTIGYLDASDAFTTIETYGSALSFSLASIINRSGVVTSLNMTNMNLEVDNIAVPSGLNMYTNDIERYLDSVLIDSSRSGAYPLMAASYYIVRTNLYTALTQDQVRFTLNYLWWTLSNSSAIDCSEVAAPLQIEPGSRMAVRMMALSAIVLLMAANAAILLGILWYRHHEIIKSISWMCCTVIMVGCFGGQFAALMYLLAPTTTLCTTRVMLPAMSFTLVFSQGSSFIHSDTTLIALAMIAVVAQFILGMIWRQANRPTAVLLIVDSESFLDCGYVNPFDAYLAIIYTLAVLLILACMIMATLTRTTRKKLKESSETWRSVIVVMVALLLGTLVVYELLVLPNSRTITITRNVVVAVLMGLASFGVPVALYAKRLALIMLQTTTGSEFEAGYTGTAVPDLKFEAPQDNIQLSEVHTFDTRLRLLNSTGIEATRYLLFVFPEVDRLVMADVQEISVQEPAIVKLSSCDIVKGGQIRKSTSNFSNEPLPTTSAQVSSSFLVPLKQVAATATATAIPKATLLIRSGVFSYEIEFEKRAHLNQFFELYEQARRRFMCHVHGSDKDGRSTESSSLNE
ncbi:uncharacterized protein BJ171DRAFT_636050 [Polychytrium aggregatum]|uniref:uncharacterized protein n=1 Tax=Polychytrium aggregatum TaxID=110093 RepID=UPI0022FECDB9|nr:uncharacterized protein BJ171DRAFT_636050 [Polychytrium aggregatum]KAI9207758.1 hypothetical protein BJ171DRAFT_636050 [Polychytrium aggregatum]